MSLADSRLSVVIPAHNSAGHLRQCLEALRQSPAQPLEVIVVDDGSIDDSAAVAREFGAQVLPTESRGGPAKARNFGANHARGEILFFLDADVCVHADTLDRVEEAFATDPDLDAVIGSYDDSPGAEDFLSQYKNLMHSFVHQHARQQASTFWSGCGAIRRTLFLEYGGFDESYGRPSIEDIELGYRLRSEGRKLSLHRDIQVKHLKQWSFWALVKTDIFDRGIPWTELILRDRHMPNDLNVQLSQRVSVALVFLLSGMSLFAAVWWHGYFFLPLFGILFLVLGRYWVEHANSKERRRGVIWTTLIVALIVVAAVLYHMAVMIPPLVLGWVLLHVRHRYEWKSAGWVYSTALLAASLAALLIFFMFYIPFHRFVFSVILVAFVVVLLNTQFYLFLAEKKGRAFALAAIPFHLLYHFYNGISFLAGTVRFYWRTGRLAGRDKTPVPARPKTGSVRTS